jgi:hypothetical protein
MAKDPRKMSAFESGMRGSSKPKIRSGNGRGEAGTDGPDGGSGSENRQQAGSTVGDAKGVGLDAYTSGMRGNEKPKQKSAAAATTATGNEGGSGSSKQGANTSVGNPKGDNTAKSLGKSVDDKSLHAHTTDTYGQENNSLERDSVGLEPTAEEDDTHINIRIPKASLKRRQAGLNGN